MHNVHSAIRPLGGDSWADVQGGRAEQCARLGTPWGDSADIRGRRSRRDAPGTSGPSPGRLPFQSRVGLHQDESNALQHGDERRGAEPMAFRGESSLARRCMGTRMGRAERRCGPTRPGFKLRSNLQRHIVRVHVERLTCAKQKASTIGWQRSARTQRTHAHALVCAQEKACVRASAHCIRRHAPGRCGGEVQRRSRRGSRQTEKPDEVMPSSKRAKCSTAHCIAQPGQAHACQQAWRVAMARGETGSAAALATARG